MSILSPLNKLYTKPAIRQGSLVLVNQGFISIAMFVAGVLVARSCGKEEYGLYILAMSLLLILQGFHRALVNMPFTVQIPRITGEDRKSYQGSMLIITLLLCFLITAGIMTVYLWQGYGMSPGSMDIYDMLPLLGLVFTPIVLLDFIRNVLLSKLQIWKSTIASVFYSIILLATLFWLFATNHLSLTNAFLVLAVTTGLTSVILLWHFRNEVHFTTVNLWADFLKAWKIGKWILINVFAFMGSSQAFPWLVLLFIDQQAVAVLGACLAIAGLMIPFIRGANAYILPRMTHSYSGTGDRGVLRLLWLSIFTLGIPYALWILVGVLFGEKILILTYSHEYQGYSGLLVLLIIRNAIEGISTPISSALQTLEKPYIITASLFLGLLVTLIFGSLMISRYGLTGTGIAAIASVFVSTTWKWYGIKYSVERKNQPKQSTN